VGAVNGVLGIKKRNSLLNVFQEVEFLYLSLTMEAYSYFFKKPLKIWGAFVCYRKNVIKKAGGFEKTYTEDFEILMQMTKLGYRTATTGEAFGFTSGQKTVDEFFEQRNRWYMGNLQSLAKARRSLYLSAFSIFIIFYFVVSLPLFIYHIAYWIPQNSATAFDLIFYFVRWFTITGPVYMIYMIPQWGINLTYIFGVISGILSFILTIWALKRYNQTDFRRILATTIYFPYTLFLSVIAFVSLLTFRPSKKAYFIRK
jgi:cellulose synthase/poly-beta-1,6-N-acetylglucosamine synthase-like glycosyltransferase